MEPSMSWWSSPRERGREGGREGENEERLVEIVMIFMEWEKESFSSTTTSLPPFRWEIHF